MHSKSCIFLVTLIASCSAINQSDDKPIAYTDLYNKYCDLQTKICNYTIHPLCPTFNPLHYRVASYKFFTLKPNDISYILRTINMFRNDLAAGKIDGHKSGANLRVVKWSDDYVRVLHAKLLYGTICTEISFTGQIILEMEEFRLDTSSNGDDDQSNYRSMFSKRVVNDSTSRSPWINIFRAEFDLIGCVHYEDEEYELKTFVCYVNRYGPRDAQIKFDRLYRYGAPCTQCDTDCSLIWTSLCDENVQPVDSSWNYYKLMVYVIIGGCVALSVVFVMRLVIRTRHNKSVKLEMK